MIRRIFFGQAATTIFAAFMQVTAASADADTAQLQTQQPIILCPGISLMGAFCDPRDGLVKAEFMRCSMINNAHGEPDQNSSLAPNLYRFLFTEERVQAAIAGNIELRDNSDDPELQQAARQELELFGTAKKLMSRVERPCRRAPSSGSVPST